MFQSSMFWNKCKNWHGQWQNSHTVPQYSLAQGYSESTQNDFVLLADNLFYAPTTLRLS